MKQHFCREWETQGLYGAWDKANDIKIFIINNDEPTGPSYQEVKNKIKESTTQVVITQTDSFIHLFLFNIYLLNMY